MQTQWYGLEVLEYGTIDDYDDVFYEISILCYKN